MTAQTYAEYERKMNATNAGGGTYFGAAFDAISQFVNKTEGLRDISVIFFTDGQDGNK